MRRLKTRISRRPFQGPAPPINIDGIANEAAWESSEAYNEFFLVNGASDDDDDLSASWRGLWDDSNLYLYIEVTDDVVLEIEEGGDWNNDGLEIYIDTGAFGKGDDPEVTDYGPGAGPNEFPVYQMTLLAGQNKLFNGINHMKWVELADENGEFMEDDDGVPLVNGVAIAEESKYSLEVALPWSTLGETTPADIIERGFFGLGFAMNDDDDEGGRDGQIMWATENPNLWMDATGFPDVELGPSVGGTGYQPLVDPFGSDWTAADDPSETEWNHDNGSDQWEGELGIADGEAGGVELLDQGGVDFIRVQDALTSGGTGDNRKLMFTKTVFEEGDDPLDVGAEGVTMHVRTRLSSPVQGLPLEDRGDGDPWPAEGDGTRVRFGGKGSFGLDTAIGNFGFALGRGDADELIVNADGETASGLMLNGINGGDEDGNLFPLDDASLIDWQEFWIQIIPEDGPDGGTHKVTVFANGSTTGTEFFVTPGGDNVGGAPEPSLYFGNAATDHTAAFDYDFIYLVKGIVDPVSGGASGPTLFFDFNDGQEPEGLEITSNDAATTEVREEGGVDDSGYIALTDNEGSARAGIIFPDPTGGRAVKAFKFSVDARIGGGTERPADGFSINLVRPDDPLLTEEPRGEGWAGGFANIGGLQEEGSQTGLAIGFDTWENGVLEGDDETDLIGFSVRVDGELVDQFPAAVLNGEPGDVNSLQTGPRNEDDPDDPFGLLTWQRFEVELTEDGKVDIFWKGQTVVEDLQTNFFASPVQIVFGARTGGANEAHHFDNISLTVTPANLVTVSRVRGAPNGLSFELSNTDESTLDKQSIALTVDGVEVTPVVTDVEGGVNIFYAADPLWNPGTTHTYNLVAKDTDGADAIRSGAGEVSLKDGLLPFMTALPGPEPIDGMWSVRYIFDAGTIGGLAAAVNAIQDAASPDFEGQIVDVAQQFMDDGSGGGGIFSEAEVEYPDEVFDNDAWTGEDFVVFGRGFMNITDPGTYTFGVHTDDGFAFRIFGAEFSAENGGGLIDSVSPDTLAFPAPTGNSDTRGTVELAAGSYEVEFLWYERGGGDGGELYAAKGDFAADEDTDEWALVGHADGIQLGGASALPFQITALARTGTNAAITWESSEGSTYVIEKSTDLQDFQELTDGFESQGDATTFTDEAATEAEAYYRVRQE